MKQPDRISYSLGMKINMGNYESADLHVGLSSDVREGETQESAMKRIKKFVEAQAEKEANEIRDSRKEE